MDNVPSLRNGRAAVGIRQFIRSPSIPHQITDGIPVGQVVPRVGGCGCVW